MTWASASVALLPFKYSIRFGCVRLGQRRLAVGDCLWAIEAASRHLPWRMACIEKGMVAQRLLRSAGLDARLQYGARHETELEAHVWVTVNGRTVIGGEEAKGFTALATYP